MDFRIASAHQTIAIDLMQGSKTLLSIDETTSGGWQAWKTAQAATTLPLEVGEHTFRLFARSGGWNINWFELTLDENLPQYTIETMHNSGGHIIPAASIIARQGASQSFSFVAEQNYAIEEVFLDGASLGNVKSYTIDNITSNHTIEVVFKSVIGGIHNVRSASSVKVYPNPARNFIYVEQTNAKDGHVRLVNISGQVVLDKVIGSTRQRIELADLPKGTYVLTFRTKTSIDRAMVVLE